MRLTTLAGVSLALLAGAASANPPEAFGDQMFDSASMFVSACADYNKTGALSKEDQAAALICSAYLYGAYDTFAAAHADTMDCPTITARQAMDQASKLFYAGPDAPGSLGMLMIQTAEKLCRPKA